MIDNVGNIDVDGWVLKLILKKEDGNFKDMSPTILSVRRRVRRVEF
jgi:hypothetical protein